ncbi:MAG: copper amine oxidase N-terminal domain-containing protein [Bacillota bacterium]|jgi:hypothetical protein
MLFGVSSRLKGKERVYKCLFRKRLLISVVCLLLLVMLAGQIDAAPPAGIRIFVDDQQLPVSGNLPIENGRILVPIRPIFEALGAKVNWDDAAKAVEAVGEKSRIRLILPPFYRPRPGGWKKSASTGLSPQA